eukprot:6044200-Amphidinium_carterae.1
MPKAYIYVACEYSLLLPIAVAGTSSAGVLMYFGKKEKEDDAMLDPPRVRLVGKPLLLSKVGPGIAFPMKNFQDIWRLLLPYCGMPGTCVSTYLQQQT